MIVNETQLQKLRDENTRDVPLPDGTTVPVCLPGELWEEVQFLEVVDEIPMREMSAFCVGRDGTAEHRLHFGFSLYRRSSCSSLEIASQSKAGFTSRSQVSGSNPPKHALKQKGHSSHVRVRWSKACLA